MTAPRDIFRSRHSTRPGISLLEVLFSIFVIGIGLLGLAALVPIGHLQLVRGAIEDNKSALGQTGLREIKIRRLLSPSRWCSISPDWRDVSGQDALMRDPQPAGQPAQWWTGLTQLTANQIADLSIRDHAVDREVLLELRSNSAFAIDPLLIARATGTTSNSRFPANSSNGDPSMLRVTLREIYGTLAQTGGTTWRNQRQRLAEEIFMGPSDLSIAHEIPPGGIDEIAYQVGASLDVRAALRRRAFQGEYSWMITVVREPGILDDSNANEPNPSDHERPVTVSVVVFLKRNLDPNDSQREPLARIQFDGAGWGGGDVTITDTAGGPVSQQVRERLRPGRWVMVFAQAPGITNPDGATGRTFFRWYKLATVDSSQDPYAVTLQNPEIFATLHGPDWPSWMPTTATALVMDGVVGVYEEKMQFEQDSAWTAGFPREPVLRNH
jgi:hypothetical protein